jgi:hypothetical protein
MSLAEQPFEIPHSKSLTIIALILFSFEWFVGDRYRR